VLVWTDAGNETDHSHIPVPSTEGFTTVSSQLAFCPVFFESQLTESQHQQTSDNTFTTRPSKQPLALLSNSYGATIDWAECTDPSPLYILQEILAFQAASALQYINMVEQVLSDHLGRGKFPSYEHTKLETILHFDYAKAVLTRSQLHFTEVLSFLAKPPLRWQSKASVTDSADQPEFMSLLQGDFSYLISRVERLVSICDAGKATLMSNASVQESNRSAEEARLVTKLTKATNRVTFIFLPISYVTAVFGMNFSQFGQGSLSIWLWVVITLPLLIVSVVVVERGGWILERFQRRK
jgi:Mg2+ and Co2+ transporter CorA